MKYLSLILLIVVACSCDLVRNKTVVHKSIVFLYDEDINGYIPGTILSDYYESNKFIVDTIPNTLLCEFDLIIIKKSNNRRKIRIYDSS
jgi:hypothetical protein